MLGIPASSRLAGALYVAEFVADKVPVFDSVWDAVHTFIRIPAGAVLAFALLPTCRSRGAPRRRSSAARWRCPLTG